MNFKACYRPHFYLRVWWLATKPKARLGGESSSGLVIDKPKIEQWPCSIFLFNVILLAFTIRYGKISRIILLKECGVVSENNLSRFLQEWLQSRSANRWSLSLDLRFTRVPCSGENVIYHHQGNMAVITLRWRNQKSRAWHGFTTRTSK